MEDFHIMSGQEAGQCFHQVFGKLTLDVAWTIDVGRWTLDVGRWTTIFSAISAVKALVS